MFTFPLGFLGGLESGLFRTNVGSYVGNGTAQTIDTDSDMDMLFILGTTAIEKAIIFRDRPGAYTPLYNNALEVASATAVTGYGDDSFSIGSNVLVNAVGVNYDWYGWRKAIGYFSTFSYVGNGSSQDVPHLLGGINVPRMIVVKKATTGSGQYGIMWDAFQSNVTLAYGIGQSVGRITGVDASKFTVDNNLDVNTNGATYTGYAFGTVPGASSFGQYIGNASLDGPVVTTGFPPKVVYIVNRQQSSINAGWFSTTHPDANYRNSASPVARTSDPSTGRISFSDTGFQIVSTAAGINSNGLSHFYAAWS